MDLEEIGCEGVDWINLVQGRDRWLVLVSAVINLQVSRNAGNFLIRIGAVGFSRRTVCSVGIIYKTHTNQN
jgi:hypothetical protein